MVIWPGRLFGDVDKPVDVLADVFQSSDILFVKRTNMGNVHKFQLNDTQATKRLLMVVSMSDKSVKLSFDIDNLFSRLFLPTSVL